MDKIARRIFLACLLVWSALVGPTHALELQTRNIGQAVVLSYHDVKRPGEKMLQEDVDVERLEDQFEYMRVKGYSVIPLAELIEHKSSGKPLPDNSVVLTFDDGYQSFYTKVFPLLKKYRYPATLALVTGWMELKPYEEVDYNGLKIRRNQFISWEQAIEMHKSGLVEIASHTHDLHHGVIANPQGSLMPAAISPVYDGKNFESTKQYEQRIKNDLSKSREIIEGKLGLKPSTLVWPYGQFSSTSRDIAKTLGFKSALTLKDYADSDEFDALTVPRKMLVGNPDIASFRDYLENSNEYLPSVIKRIEDLTEYATLDKEEKGLSALIDSSVKQGWKGVILPAKVQGQWAFRTQEGPYIDWIQRSTWRLSKGIGVEAAVDLTEILNSPSADALLNDLARQSSLWGVYIRNGNPGEIQKALDIFPMAYVLLEEPMAFENWSHRTWVVSNQPCKTSQCFGSVSKSEQLKWRKTSSPYVVVNH